MWFGGCDDGEEVHGALSLMRFIHTILPLILAMSPESHRKAELQRLERRKRLLLRLTVVEEGLHDHVLAVAYATRQR